MVETEVELRQLGKSDIQISALGLGCWQFSEGSGMVGGYWPALSPEAVEEIVQTSLQGGINWFDTAEVYGNGKSEEALAQALLSLGDEGKKALIATKWWPAFRSSSSIGKTINQRKDALKGLPIDLYQVHQPFSFSSIESEMKEMTKLLKTGHVRSVGVSNFSEGKMRQAHQALRERGFPLVSNQVKYSLLDRRIEKNGVMELAKKLGITIIAYSPLEQGILSGKFHKDPSLIKSSKGPRKYMNIFKESGLQRTAPLIELLDRLAEEYGVTTSQVALNWLIHFHGETVVAIPGATKIHHAKENVGALTFKLSEKHLKEIDELSRGISKF